MISSGTVHGNAIISTVRNVFTDNPEWVPILAEYQIRINTGFYDAWYLDAVVQRPDGTIYDIFDAYCFAQIHTMVMGGDVLIGRVDVEAEPLGDKAIGENASLLRNLPSPFWATFTGGLADFDGRLGWNHEIVLGQYDAGGHVVEQAFMPESVRLEVGYTTSSRSLLHVLESGGVARWPYGSPSIHLFKVAHWNQPHTIEIERNWSEPTPLQPALFHFDDVTTLTPEQEISEATLTQHRMMWYE